VKRRSTALRVTAGVRPPRRMAPKTGANRRYLGIYWERRFGNTRKSPFYGAERGNLITPHVIQGHVAFTAVEVRVLSRALLTVPLQRWIGTASRGIFFFPLPLNRQRCRTGERVRATGPTGSRAPTAVGAWRFESSLGHQQKRPSAPATGGLRGIFHLGPSPRFCVESQSIAPNRKVVGEL
jgi:hypothetical protein